MGLFRRKVPHDYVIHPDNIATNNWIILLEAGTIVGVQNAQKLRVAKATLEKRSRKNTTSFSEKSSS